jgi:hypothetical protein
MRLAKASIVVVLLAVAFALGVWLSPRLVHHRTEEAAAAAQNEAPPAEPAHAASARHQRAAAKRAEAKSAASSATAAPTRVTTISASEPELQQRLKPLLNRGADMSIASRDFRDGEQFATIAHAARNTDIPFMVLKHGVIDEGKSLPAAIREFKPALDATGEADRARAQAKSDIAGIKG